MMTRVMSLCLLALVLVGARPADAQQCTTVNSSSPRRAEALRAARLFNSAAASQRGAPIGPSVPGRKLPPYPAWEDVGAAPIIALWRSQGGPMGDLVRKIQWGDPQPLAGWHMHWIANEDGYAFTLTDTRDSCGFSYASDERGDILQSVAVDSVATVVPVQTQ